MNWKKLLSFVPGVGGLIGGALSGGSQASASNRGTAIEAGLAQEAIRQQQMRDWENAMNARSQEARANQGDAWKRLQQSSYVTNWQPSAARFSPYSKPLTAPSFEARQGATSLMEQTRDDLMAGRFRAPQMGDLARPQPYTIDPKLLKPGAWEQISGYAGAGLTGLGAWDKLRRQTQPTTP